MMPGRRSLASLKDTGREQALDRVRVARDAEVVEVSAGGTRCTVKLLANERRLAPTGERYDIESPSSSPPLRVAYLAAGGRYFGLTPKAGDRVLVLCVDRSPDDLFRFQPAHDVVLPCVDLAEGDLAPGGDPVIGYPDGEALRAGGPNAATWVARADNTASKIAAIETHLNTVTYTVTSGATVPDLTLPFLVPTTADDIRSNRLATDDA